MTHDDASGPIEPVQKRKRLTQRQIARKLGLSAATVSMALRDDPLVAEETRARVKAAAQEAGYLYNAAAAALRHGRTRLLGVALADAKRDAELLDAIETRASAQGWSLMVSFHRGENARLKRFAADLAGRGAEGVIALTPADVEADWAAPLDAAGAKIARIADGPFELTDVTYGEAAATAAGIEHLMGLGHRRIALVGGSLDDPRAEARAEAFRAARRLSGAAPEDWPWLRGPSAATRAIANPIPPTAILAWDEAAVEAVLGAAAAHLLDVGRDVSVLALEEVGSRELSYVASDPERAAEAALAAMGVADGAARSARARIRATRLRAGQSAAPVLEAPDALAVPTALAG